VPARSDLALPAKRRWADLRLRILSGVLLAALGLGGLWLGGLAWRVLIGVAASGLAIEWATLCRRLHGARRWAAALAGMPYVGLATAALLWLRGHDAVGARSVLFLLLVVWASDIGAYLAGRALGGPLLAPAISPGKTWTGAAGGLLAAMLAGLAVAGWDAAGPALLAGVALGVAAQAGDLLESAIKRGFRVKDSGSLIPGHGGLFDRLDGILVAAPVAALLAMRAGNGVVFWK
jgi:phosphatidate cytidylyltransferase